MEIVSYVPCPACHDDGGGGTISRWKIGQSRKVYCCDECDATWTGLPLRPGAQTLFAQFLRTLPEDDQCLEQLSTLALEDRLLKVVSLQLHQYKLVRLRTTVRFDYWRLRTSEDPQIGVDLFMMEDRTHNMRNFVSTGFVETGKTLP